MRARPLATPSQDPYIKPVRPSVSPSSWYQRHHACPAAPVLSCPYWQPGYQPARQSASQPDRQPDSQTARLPCFSPRGTSPYHPRDRQEPVVCLLSFPLPLPPPSLPLLRWHRRGQTPASHPGNAPFRRDFQQTSSCHFRPWIAWTCRPCPGPTTTRRSDSRPHSNRSRLPVTISRPLPSSGEHRLPAGDVAA